MSALEVAKKIRQEGVYVSNQLNQLVTDDIVERKENEIYQLKDRFFNIWFLMRYGRKSKDKVLFLIKFFAEWLDRFESNDRARLVVKEYWQKDIDPVTFQLLATAISQLDVLTQEVRREINEALAQSETSSTTQPPPQYSLAHHTDIRKKFLANEFIDGARIGQFREDLIAAPMGLESKSKIIDSFPKLDLDKFERIWQVLKREIQKLRDYAWQNYGQQYATCGNEGQYLSIVEALFKNDLDLAIYYIQKIVDSTCEDAATRERIAELHLRIGEQLYQQNDFERTETAYTEAIRFGSVNANFKLALMYEMEDKLKNLDKAVHFYKEALRLNYSNKAENLFRVGHIYLMKKQYIGAEQCFLQSFDIKRSLPCIYNLVQIYAYLDTELHSFSKAESLLLATLNLETYANDKAGYYNSIAWLYLHYGVKKEEALINSRKAVEFNATDINFIHTLSDILLWNNCFEESFSVAEQFMYNEDFLKESDYEQLTTYFLMLCAKRQYDHLYNYFMGERGISISSKDRFRPIYFALMHLMKDTYPLEYLKMGSELEVTVNEILTKIEEMSVKYG